MKKLRQGWVGLSLGTISVLGLGWTSSPAHAENTRVTNPNALAIEVGGRGLLYTIGFDRVLSEKLAAGIGFGTAGTTAGSSGMILPAYLNFYFSQEAGSLFGTVGAALIMNSSSVVGQTSTMGAMQFPATPLVLQFGAGYEYRSDANFLVRLTAYGMIAQNIIPWGGISFGYSF